MFKVLKKIILLILLGCELLFCTVSYAETQEELASRFVTRNEWSAWVNTFSKNFEQLDYSINTSLYNEIRYEMWARDINDKTDPVVDIKQIEQYTMKKGAIETGQGSDVYPVTFVMNGGYWKSDKQPIMYRKGNEETKLPNEQDIYSIDGKVFVGWYDNINESGNTVTSVPANTHKATIYYAKWGYTITYELNGGEWNSFVPTNTRSFNEEVVLPTSANMIFANHMFVDWYDNPLFTGEPVTKISAGTARNITVYAKWEEVVYAMNYHLDNGTTSVSLPTTRKYFESISLPNNDEMTPKAGYKFRGWFADANHTTLITEVSANTTVTDVYAGFEKMTSWKNSSGNYDINYSSWMSKIPDDMYLSEINIPGSHESGCKDVSSVVLGTLTEYATTQNHYVVGDDSQLEQGVRALDIKFDSDAKLMHGNRKVKVKIGTQVREYNTIFRCVDENSENITLDMVFDKVSSFLDNNPTETVVLFINKDYDSWNVQKAKDAVNTCKNKYVSGYNGRTYYKGVYSGTTIPKLGDVRGKIVILSDGLSDGSCIDYSGMKGDILDGVSYVYENHSEEEKDDKWGYVEKALNSCTTKINTQINKSNKTAKSANIWTTSSREKYETSFALKPNSYASVDETIDPLRRSYNWVQGNAYGIIWMDFVEKNDTNYVIASNP